MGVLERGDRDNDNETGLKEGGGIEMSIYSASIHYNDNYNLLYSDTTKYTVWACLKGMTL